MNPAPPDLPPSPTFPGSPDHFRSASWSLFFLLGGQSELQLPAYTTAPATPDPSLICNLYPSSRQRRILNPLSEAGIKLESPWILVRFLTAEPQWERQALFSL